jgi:hypothetical protein
MYKYLLFGFDYHYPSGGMDDLILKFNSFDEFLTNFKFSNYDQFQLVDTGDNYSYTTFDSKITFHYGKDNWEVIRKKKEYEFVDWMRNSIN